MKKNYDPNLIEENLYKNWEDCGYFEAKPDNKKESFCIMIPPPNVTGTLHMGHGFQNTLMDCLIRYKRMKGFDVLWQVGVDHAGIATQMVVERQLEIEGTTKEELGRYKFEKKVWDWKENSGSIITKQLRRLGASADWSREAFTMNEGLSNAVLKVFVSLYDEGLIYQGERLVNWDVKLQTALSDLEVTSEEENGKLWHFDYPIKDGGNLTVATTRPETMLGDVAVAINPKDKRFKKFVGKMVTLPLADREIPIIEDAYVDKNFGSGCVKITPAHDFNDFEIGKRHNLQLINIFNLDGTLNQNVPKKYEGLTISAARKEVISDMESLGLVNKIEDYKVTVPKGDRSGSILEPIVTKQWFMKMDSLSKKALKVVEKKEIQFIPKNWENTYYSWMRDIQDWCISRQLWWGHRIPAWYDDENNVFVGSSEEDVRKKYNLDKTCKLKQEEDVLDTWFSSALWTFSTLGWPKKSKFLGRYHPTSVLVTGFDIIFFWVARMIMMTTHFIDEIPFKKILIHGLIRDSEGQKMSKSKGNTIDPLDIIDGINLEDLISKRTEGLMQPKLKTKIAQLTKKEFPDGIKAYGTDSLRLTFCSLASGTRDINFDIKRVEGYRNFCNKIWNASRFIDIQLEKINLSNKENDDVIEEWISHKFNLCLNQVEKALNEYRFDLATKSIYEFIWYEFCDWYIELNKLRLSHSAVDDDAKGRILLSMIKIFEKTLRMAHPIIPYITEEIWLHYLKIHKIKSKSIMISEFPVTINGNLEDSFLSIEFVKKLITRIRNIRSEFQIKPSINIECLIRTEISNDRKIIEQLSLYLEELCGIKEIKFLDKNDSPPPSSIIIQDKCKIFIPLEGLIDPDEELNRLKNRMDKLKKENEILNNKLLNNKFIKNAPKELVEKEKQRANFLLEEIEQINLHQREVRKLLVNN